MAAQQQQAYQDQIAAQQRADYGDEANDYYPEGAEGAEGQQQDYGEEQYWNRKEDFKVFE
jgi:hypothetical protein